MLIYKIDFFIFQLRRVVIYTPIINFYAFALCVASAYFQKYSNVVFADLVDKYIIIIYMDNLIIPD